MQSNDPNMLSPLDKQARQMALLLHLSQFAGYVVPLAGLVVPIIIWQMKKDELPLIDAHGKNVVNWIISEIIYFIVSGILCIVLIGFLLLAVMCVIAIVFPIIGGIKANNGEVWKYPLTITFIK